MPEPARDLRNTSRDFESCGLQKLADMRLNPFALELFVESYLNVLESTKDTPLKLDQEPLKILFRGCHVTIEPGDEVKRWLEEHRAAG